MAINDGYDDRETFIPVATPIDGPVGLRSEDANPLRLETVPRSRAVGHLAILCATFLLLQIAAVVLLGSPSDDPNLPIDIAPSVGLAITIATGCIVVVAAILLVRASGGSAASIGLSLKGWHIECAWGLLIAVISFAAFFATNLTIYFLWPEGSAQLQENPQHVKDMLPQLDPLWIIPTMLIVAAWEEAAFRGILLTHLRRIGGGAGWAIPVILSSLLFGAMHLAGQVPAAAISLTVLGVVWSLTTLWRGSIIASAVGHALFNMGQLLIIYLMDRFGVSP